MQRSQSAKQQTAMFYGLDLLSKTFEQQELETNLMDVDLDQN